MMTKDDALKKAENNWEISSLLQYTQQRQACILYLLGFSFFDVCQIFHKRRHISGIYTVATSSVLTITNFCAQIGNVYRSNGHVTEKMTAATKVMNQLIFVKVS